MKRYFIPFYRFKGATTGPETSITIIHSQTHGLERSIIPAFNSGGGILKLPSPETHQNNQSETTPVPPAGKPKGKGRLRIVTEKKGRGGKTATIIFGFDENVTDEEISALAAKLKKKLSTGGSARGGEILIQGERGCRCRPNSLGRRILNREVEGVQYTDSNVGFKTTPS